MSTRREKTRERILRATLGLLLERGFHGFGLDEVGRAANVSRQAVYLHFGSKAGLLEALVEYVPQIEGRPELDHLPADEAVVAIIRFNAGYLTRIRRFASLIHSARAEVPEAAAAWRRRMDFIRGRCRQMALRLADEGLLAEGWSVENAADLFWAVISFPVYEYLVIDAGWSTERYETELSRMVRRAFVGSRIPGE